MKKLVLILGAVLTLQACSKDVKEGETSEVPVADSFDELVAPDNFNWSSSNQGTLKVTLLNSKDAPADLDGGELWIRNAQGKRVAQAAIKNLKATYTLSVPAVLQGLEYYLPATGQSWPLEKFENTSLQLRNALDTVAFSGSQKGKYQGSTAGALPPGTNVLGNADFEQNSFDDNAGFNFDPTTATVDGKKWTITDKDYIWSTENGSKVLKAKNGRWTHFWQLHSVSAGDSIYFTAGDFSGNARVFLFYYADNQSTNYKGSEVARLSTNPEGIKSVVPQGVTVVSALVNIFDKAWVDDAFLSTVPAITDTDGDGIADENDDFPNDANRAFASTYPNVGRQTVAFEDLWPSKGDYDFNDMVINSKINIVRNAQQELVEAKVKLSLDAVGGGLTSGLALRLVQSNKSKFNNNFISTVSGDASVDPNVNNGIIIFNDPDELRSQFYDNTRTNFIATPDTAEFTITFNSGVSNAFISDYFIFRNGERGREIHLPGFAGTAAADATLNNTKDDINGTYKTAAGLPWAMELVLDGTHFQHPREKVDMIKAYPQFSSWAGSGGENNVTWYQNPTGGETIDLGL